MPLGSSSIRRDIRPAQFRHGPTPRSQHDSLHFHLVEGVLGYCWCRCARCWDAPTAKCICRDCPCPRSWRIWL